MAISVPEMRALEEGNPREWDVAFRLLWPIAFSAARRCLENNYPSDVDDVASVAITDAKKEVQSRKVPNFDRLRALTVVIANRRAKDHVRRMQAERRASGKTETLEGRDDLTCTAPGLLDEVNRDELAKLLENLMTRLPERQYLLLRAYHLERRTHAEIAKKFHMKMGTVGVTLSRGLKSLRKELHKQPQLEKELFETLR